MFVEVCEVWRGNGWWHSHEIFRVNGPNRRTCDFAFFRGAWRMLHVARAAAWRLAKSCSQPCRSKGRHRRHQICRSRVYSPDVCAFVVATLVGCWLHAPGAENFFDARSSGSRKLWARDTKLGTWVHLGKAYLAPYELMGWSAVCTCCQRR